MSLSAVVTSWLGGCISQVPGGGRSGYRVAPEAALAETRTDASGTFSSAAERR